MKGRYCMAFFFFAAALLFPSVSGLSQNAADPSKSSIKHKKAARSALQVPKLNSDGSYVVRRGDSIIRIARIFKTTPDELMSANNLRRDKIKIGQELKIPGAQNDTAKAQAMAVMEAADPAGALSISSVDSQQEDQDQSAYAIAEPLRMRLVKAGFEWIGVRYRIAGSSETGGFDCSGLVKSLFSKFNIELPRSSREQFKQGQKVDRHMLEAGDLVFFSSGGDLPTHVGIYVGDNKFLHAARKARQVMVSDLSKVWKSMRYLGARRIMDLWWEEPGSTAEGD